MIRLYSVCLIPFHRLFFLLMVVLVDYLHTIFAALFLFFCRVCRFTEMYGNKV